jgi:AP-2 complex subunit alpha
MYIDCLYHRTHIVDCAHFRTSKSFVKKKAALTLLRLYRKHTAILQPEWADRILSILDDADLGVTLSVTHLVLGLLQDHLDEYRGCYPKAVRRLKQVRLIKRLLTQITMDGHVQQDYIYYGVGAPWLQVGLLRMLQYYPPSKDENIRNLLHTILQTILQAAISITGPINPTQPKNIQQSNAQNAILFEAINLVIHIAASGEEGEENLTGLESRERDPLVSQLIRQVSSLLGKFITARETNVRYLGLESMAHLASHEESLEYLRKHQQTVLLALRDKDISVRRRALDLLYSMCNASNAKSTVQELLRNLSSADYSLREEMVLKIAILAEKYATESQWYVDVTLQLISQAGAQVPEEVWFRIVQIVTNNEEIQEYAVKTALGHLKSALPGNESIVKVAAYILGEFGHLIANETGSGAEPVDQFEALKSKWDQSSPSTRAMILSTYIKFVNLFPEIKGPIMELLKQYALSLDTEIQTRASEFLVMASELPGMEEVLITVCEEMPVFEARESALLRRMHKSVLEGEREGALKRTWLVGGKDARNEKEALKLKLPARKSNPNGHVVPNTPSAAELDLSGLQLAPDENDDSLLSVGWQPGFDRLLLKEDGLLFEDSMIQIGLRSEYHGNQGRVALYFGNKLAPGTHFTSFTVTVTSRPGLTYSSPTLPNTMLEGGAQMQWLMDFQSQQAFSGEPRIKITFIAGSLQTIRLKLPVVLSKFMAPAPLPSPEDFFKRWKQIGPGEPHEKQLVFVSVGSIDLIKAKKVVEGLRWAILHGVDKVAENIVGAGVVSTDKGKAGCLLRLEPNLERALWRVTVRGTDDGNIF